MGRSIMEQRQRMGYSTIVIYVGLLMVLLVEVCANSTALARQRDVALTSRRNKCWVFSHMNKSGGQTIKFLLKTWLEDHPRLRSEQFDTEEWVMGEAFAHNFAQTNATIIWGSYTEGLRLHGLGRCKWFTMFRHPVSRLVSAFFFCKQKPEDPLCGSHILNAGSTDLLTFARHWGNFGLRQLVLPFILPEDAIAVELDREVSVCVRDRESGEFLPKCSAWYLVKLFFESHGAVHSSHEKEDSARESDDISLTDFWMHKFLKPVENLLSKRYTAVGLLEQWDTSMHLYNAALEIPNFDWIIASEERGMKNTNAGRTDDAHQNDEATALKMALNDPDIKEALWLDILLYDHAVTIFNRQISWHGLS